MTRIDTVWKWSGRGFVVSLALFGCSGALWAWPVDPITSERRCQPERRDVDIVLCLDTSSSMNGLIDSARARLWDVVNSLASAKPTPRLRVGLLTYGSPHISTAAQGWVVKQTDLTSDLDTVYSRMMGMSINGGDEYVGWVLNDAVNGMSWSTDPKALRLIFVAGNESADQASNYYNFRSVAHVARAKDITINAIFAGPRENGVSERWAEVASCGGGSYSGIDMQCGTVQIQTPQDKLLLDLNLKLNATYVPYGDAGMRGAKNQLEQDAAANKMGQASVASRVAAKGTTLYDNAGWDLVDAVAQGRVEVKDVKKEDLPAAMQALPIEEREKYVKKNFAERTDIQRQITETQDARAKFLKTARVQASGGRTALGEAMEKALLEQAKAKGFEFDEKK